MSEYRWSLIKYLKVKYYVWQAERLLKKELKMLKETHRLNKQVEEYNKKARKILEEMRW